MARFLAFVAASAVAVQAHAFHSGGVGECEGCHSMHNSFEGSASGAGQAVGQANAYLLRGADAGSSCLYCHQATGDSTASAYFVSTADADLAGQNPPRQLTPGGDFGWLKKSYTWTTSAGGPTLQSPGERHGHNVVAADFSYVADQTNTVAPGGSYPAAALSCISCHDPHGRYRRFADGSVATSGLPTASSGSYADSPAPVAGGFAVGAYRLLGGKGYQPRSLAGSFGFAADPPIAVAPPDYNRSEASTQTRVAYGQGMSEWCANCHPGMLQGGSTGNMKGLSHPVGNGAKFPNGIAMNYLAYVRTGVLTNTDATRSYWSLVPFEEGTSDQALLKRHAVTDDSFLNGPDTTNSNVACVTCHRAHASGFDATMRFRDGNDFITVADGAGAAVWPDPAANPAQAQGRSTAETQQAYYGRPAAAYAPFQRTLCNKCHAKD